VAEDWRGLHDEELHNFVRFTKYYILVGKLKGRDHSEDLGVDGK
jgi:hypothetical protein